MKALTLTQPWATLIACGAKRIETRSWSTSYRGALAIHAAKGLAPVGGKRGFQEQCATPPFEQVLSKWFEEFGATKSAYKAGWVMPLGAVVAVGRLVAVKPTSMALRAELLAQTITPHEIDFGDYSNGRFAWYLENVSFLEQPIECSGALSIWDLSPEIEAAVTAQLTKLTKGVSVITWKP